MRGFIWLILALWKVFVIWTSYWVFFSFLAKEEEGACRLGPCHLQTSSTQGHVCTVQGTWVISSEHIFCLICEMLKTCHGMRDLYKCLWTLLLCSKCVLLHIFVHWTLTDNEILKIHCKAAIELKTPHKKLYEFCIWSVNTVYLNTFCPFPPTFFFFCLFLWSVCIFVNVSRLSFSLPALLKKCHYGDGFVFKMNDFFYTLIWMVKIIIYVHILSKKQKKEIDLVFLCLLRFMSAAHTSPDH